MKQVPIVNNNLRRNVEGRRFERSTDKNLGYAATLAAIAQAASFDTAYCADEADEAKWRELSAALRDATAQVAIQVRKGDQEAAVKALGAVETSCMACHTAFEVE
jgi:cytochrome c556